MESFRLINNYTNNLYKKGISSFSNINHLNDSGELAKKFNELNIKKLLNQEFGILLEILFDDNKYYYNKKLILEASLTPWINPVSEYALATYLGNKNIYKNLPLLFKEIIDKTNIVYYKHLTLNDIKAQIFKYYDVVETVDNNKLLCEYKPKPLMNSFLYNKYNSNYNGIDISNKSSFFITAEHYTFDLEKNQSTAWVAKDFGDGYGFDIYSFDTNLWKEKLIEVKSGSTDYFTLSENEVNVMRNSFHKGALYYIYKYTYNKSDNKIYATTLRYDNELDALVDDNSIYKIEKQDDCYLVSMNNKVKKIG